MDFTNAKAVEIAIDLKNVKEFSAILAKVSQFGNCRSLLSACVGIKLSLLALKSLHYSFYFFGQVTTNILGCEDC